MKNALMLLGAASLVAGISAGSAVAQTRRDVVVTSQSRDVVIAAPRRPVVARQRGSLGVSPDIARQRCQGSNLTVMNCMR
jgi:hypothetical protein